MMTLKFRKNIIVYLIVGFIVKFITFFLMIKYFGYSGAITSSALTSIVVIFLNLQHISNKFKVNYAKTFVRFLKMLVSCIAMNGGFAILKLVGLTIDGKGQLMALLVLCVYGIVGMAIYYYTSSLMKLPQNIFGFTLTDIVKRKLVKSNG